MDMSNYYGDYDIIVAVAIITDEPKIKPKPSSFSWAETWYSDADFTYIECESEAPEGYYLADQSWMNSNWLKVNATYPGLAYSLVYDGGHLIAPSAGGGMLGWEYPNSFNTYKTVRPGGMYRYALVVEA